MKKICLKSIGDSKDYSIYLGNGTRHNFKSKRAASDFITTTSKFLTEHLHELHAIYSDISIKYNNNWFYFDNDKSKNLAQLYQFERDVNQNIGAILNIFNISVRHANFTNGNYTTFSDFRKISNYLKDTIKILNHINEVRSNTVELYHYKTLFNRLMVLDNNLQNYGQFGSISSFEVPNVLDHSTPFIHHLK
jgi:hypothetical protein